MEMALEAAAVLPHPKITEAIEDLYDRLEGQDEAIRSVTIIALVGEPGEAKRAEYGIDQGDTPVHLRTLTQAVSGQDPARSWPFSEIPEELQGRRGERPAELAIAERRQRPDLTH